jgi:KDO2-lipid IV(A) lauroyltransferase
VTPVQAPVAVKAGEDGADGADGAPARSGLRGTLLLAAARVIARLPEAPLVAAADASGELWYRLSPARAAQARANLGRVCEGLAARGRGTGLARRAASDPEALERMVRATFRHAARYYLEVARAGGFDIATALARIDVETPAEIEAALSGGKPIVLVGMHYGAIELPVVYVSHLVGHPVMAPMESVADPGLQRWFMASRSRVGVNIVPIADARRALLRALRGGDSVGMVADRDLTHNGIPVLFFGHPAPLPAGPALLAIETGAPLYVGSARRMKGGRYRARLIHVPSPESGTRRERVTRLTSAMAGAFESILADAPEQWWAAFHPIWPDLAVEVPE